MEDSVFYDIMLVLMALMFWTLFFVTEESTLLMMALFTNMGQLYRVLR